MDVWAEWLHAGRDGGDAAYAAALRPTLDDVRDRVLDHAAIRPGDVVADIGSGDGLVAFGAFERLGDRGDVVFADVSPALLEACRRTCIARGLAARARFVSAPVEALAPIADESVDAATVRAVLTYVADKPAAMRELWRILAPGGRVSIAEPVFQDLAFVLAAVGERLRSGAGFGAHQRDIEFFHRWRARQFPATPEAILASPLTNFTERDLFRGLQNAGFTDVHLRLHVDMVSAPAAPWPVLLRLAPFPGAPTLADILPDAFDPAERAEFERRYELVVQTQRAFSRDAVAYLFATKPTERAGRSPFG